MNADTADQIRLLDVQALDVRLSQLAHKRASLPEHAELDSLTKDLTQQRDLLVAAQTQEGDTAREQVKAEQDVDQVRKRAVRDQERLDSGSVRSPKDLENLQRELTSLAKRQGDLEDIVLEVMERREATQERVTALTERVAALQAKSDDAKTRRDAATTEIDADAEAVAKDREVVVGSVPADLIALYEKIRAKQNGIGAAKLYQRRCLGCQLELDMAEINEIKAAPGNRVVRHDNCGRILVRTAESGI
ncbi:zinc ribbon domain-containing protein [Streptomyces sp. BI20]|uniref:zinc ribbon domain-containing protein n=1 Tax=Streptomyces sp. BI20 TaxID=3403460 RepID=UPI003C762E40